MGTRSVQRRARSGRGGSDAAGAPAGAGPAAGSGSPQVPLSLVQLRPRERAGDRTRARLFRAALAEFRRAGFERASIERIAHAAGLSRPAFYFHFPTKEHVLLELQGNLERETIERLAGARDLREALATFVDTMIEAEERLGESGLLRDMLILYARRPAALELDERPLPLLDAMVARFTQAAARGELRGSLAPAREALLCLTSVFGYLIAGVGSPEQRRADLLELVSLHLASPGGASWK